MKKAYIILEVNDYEIVYILSVYLDKKEAQKAIKKLNTANDCPSSRFIINEKPLNR